jgi:hypothetical protein
MKRTSRARKTAIQSDNLQPEYNFDYAKAKPNRFAKAGGAGGFASAELANSVWRLLMTPMPVRRTQAGRRG